MHHLLNRFSPSHPFRLESSEQSLLVKHLIKPHYFQFGLRKIMYSFCQIFNSIKLGHNTSYFTLHGWLFVLMMSNEWFFVCGINELNAFFKCDGNLPALWNHMSDGVKCLIFERSEVNHNHQESTSGDLTTLIYHSRMQNESHAKNKYADDCIVRSLHGFLIKDILMI